MSIIKKFTRLINKRDDGAAESPVSVIGDLPFLKSSTVSADTAMRISTVYSCIRVRAESIAMLPIRLYKIGADGSKTLAFNSDLYKLVHSQPNAWQTAAEFWENCVWCLDVYGNFYAYIVRVGDAVTELIPLQNNCVSVNYKLNTNIPEYQITIKADGKNNTQTRTIIVGEEDMLHIRLNTFDGLHGLSPIAQVNKLMFNADSTEDLAGKIYQSGAITSGVLQTDAKLDKATHKAIRDAFYSQYVGTENAGKPMILDSGMKYQQFRISLTDAQFIESRKYDRDEICGVFRIPPHMVANLDHATFSNIEQQNLQFVNQSLMPYIRRIEQRLNKCLLADRKFRNYRFKFDLSSLLRGDSTAQVNYIKSLLDSGVMTINDALTELGMNTQKGCDIRKLPLNTAYMTNDGTIVNLNNETSQIDENSVDKNTK